MVKRAVSGSGEYHRLPDTSFHRYRRMVGFTRIKMTDRNPIAIFLSIAWNQMGEVKEKAETPSPCAYEGNSHQVEVFLSIFK